MFHCETWRAQRVQQSSAVKSSLRLGDQRASAFTRDRQNVLSLNKREKVWEGRGSLAEHNVCSWEMRSRSQKVYIQFCLNLVFYCFSNLERDFVKSCKSVALKKHKTLYQKRVRRVLNPNSKQRLNILKMQAHIITHTNQ